ncbi:MAG: hypothetical protein PHE83_05055 [Opitutaceae bacterium]|nr:hypothetical protein [Opitutaceae bacterium]
MQKQMLRKGLICSSILLLFSAASHLPAQESAPPARLKRADCFFGIHFDFHAGEDCTRIGENFSEADIESFLTAVKPDFIQVDCKGHAGFSSYPTQAGQPAPGFVKDPLKIWRELTRRHGVALFVHYSGVWDYAVCQRHPDWACVGADGKKSTKATSLFGPYVDRVLIPQLKELSDVYQIDGAWIDGDCWGAEIDYSKAARQAYKKATGKKTVPKSPETAGFADYLEFNRTAFKNYVAHYVDAIHRHNPDFQITSNWSFSSMMPEPVSVKVDFLSGDLTSQNSVNSAAFEARCMALQGKPWDLMSWAFTLDWDNPSLRSYKSPVQLEQEAAEVMAMGGGFQAYFTQNRDASINPWYLPLMKSLADFCRPRKAYCHKAVPIPQIGLLHSTFGFKAITQHLYGSWEGQNTRTQGILTALLDGQNCVEIVREYTLKNNLSRYPLIIIPEWEFLEKDFCQELIKYVSTGGNLLVIGAKAVKNFEPDLGVTLLSPCPKGDFILADGEQHSGIISPFQPVALKAGTGGFGSINASIDYSAATIAGLLKAGAQKPVSGKVALDFPAATIATLGRGRIAGLYVDMGANYENFRTYGMRDFLNALVRQMLPDPLVQVSGSHLVHVAANRLNGEMMIHLINTGGKHEAKKIYNYDEVPARDNLAVTILLPAKPKAIVQQPEGVELPFVYQDGKARLQLPRLAIHTILEVRE